jgi:hypothetical protein
MVPLRGLFRPRTFIHEALLSNLSHNVLLTMWNAFSLILFRKLDLTPVSEELRSTIRGFCTGLVSSINRYYAFGSVFVDDERG